MYAGGCFRGASVKKRRLGILGIVAVVVLGAYAWGVVTGVYRVFPWNAIYPVGQQLTDALRLAGLMPPRPEERPPTQLTINTGLLNFELALVNADSPIPGHAGGMAVTARGLLIGRRSDGGLELYDFAAEALRELPFTLPSLGADRIPVRFDTGRAVRPSDIRYHDIEVIGLGDGEHLFVTYNHYDPARSCFALRLDEAALPAGWPDAGADASALAWRTVLQTEPCLPPGLDRNTLGGNQAGGRIVPAPDGGLLLTTGDYEFDGIGRKVPAVSQLNDSDYGRVLHIDLRGGEATEVSRGHRNPQALAFDATGRIWMAEHAAMGGDELSLIEPGKNYGWPVVTLGVFYTQAENDTKVWPGNAPGRHDLFELPRYAWLPSVAPSAMALARGLGPRWDGDLVVATLGFGGLRRLRLAGDRVIYDEPIRLDRRIRDIAITGGRIYLLFDDGVLGQMTPHEMRDDDPILTQASHALLDFGCIECHSNPAVPRLATVFDLDIASQPDIRYSEALQRAAGAWTRDNLATFLTSPQSFARGTTMPEPGLTPEQVDILIDELRALAQQND